VGWYYILKAIGANTKPCGPQNDEDDNVDGEGDGNNDGDGVGDDDDDNDTDDDGDNNDELADPAAWKMSPLYQWVFVLLQASATFAGTQVRFMKYPGQAISAITPVHTSTVSKPLTCHAQCLRRADCVAAAVSGSSCSLYATTVTDPATQLQDQPGTVVYNQGKI
jgi:hypothetical protein